jgi:hypothetical protein
MQGSDPEALRQATEHLRQAAARIEEAARQSGGAAQGSQACGPSPGAKSEDVVDAEFEEVGCGKR